MYVSEICADEIFVTFPWWLKNVKSRSKITLFSNERHFEIWFPKKRKQFSFSEVNYLNYAKNPILHVATTFSLKQGETGTSHGPIPHPLKPKEVCFTLFMNFKELFVSLQPDVMWFGSQWNTYRLITAYLLLRVNLDKIMHARWDFDASNAWTRRVSALDKHQNWSASALFSLNSQAQSKHAVVNLILTRRKQTFLSLIMW